MHKIQFCRHFDSITVRAKMPENSCDYNCIVFQLTYISSDRPLCEALKNTLRTNWCLRCCRQPLALQLFLWLLPPTWWLTLRLQNKTFPKRLWTIFFIGNDIIKICTSSSELSAITMEKSPPILSSTIIRFGMEKNRKKWNEIDGVHLARFFTTFIDTLLHTAELCARTKVKL